MNACALHHVQITVGIDGHAMAGIIQGELVLLDGLDCAIQVVALDAAVGVLAHLRAIRVHVILHKRVMKKISD